MFGLETHLSLLYFFVFAVVYVFSRSGKNVAGQNDRQGKKVTGQQAFLAGHFPLTGRYFKPCSEKLFAYYRDAKNMAKNVLETFIDVLQNVKGTNI